MSIIDDPQILRINYSRVEDLFPLKFSGNDIDLFTGNIDHKWSFCSNESGVLSISLAQVNFLYFSHGKYEEKGRRLCCFW